MNINRFRATRHLAALLLLLMALVPLRSWATGPTVTITAPANGAQITTSCSSGTANVGIVAVVSGLIATNPPPGDDGTPPPVSKVEFYYDGTHLIGTDFSSPYSTTWANVPFGTYTLTAKAYLSSGGVLVSAGVVITVKSPAITLDTDQSGYTFLGTKTYYIKNPITISGTTTLQNGTVLKFAPGAKLTVDTLACPSNSSNPAILTAQDDDSVGCMLAESTHTVSGYSGGSDPTVNAPSCGAGIG